MGKFFIAPFLLISTFAWASPSKVSCYWSKISQVCSNDGRLCTAPPPARPVFIAESALQESSNVSGISYQHAELAAIVLGYGLEVEATVQVESGSVKLQTLDLYTSENRGAIIRTYRSQGESRADFSYQDRRTRSADTETAKTNIFCLLQ